jgi:ADP-ribose pyrophosphatase YjhB (NUDIX family)
MALFTNISLILVRDNKLLVCRPKNLPWYTLPGGQPREREDHLTCLQREVEEEIGAVINLDHIQYLGVIRGRAVGVEGIVDVHLYYGSIEGEPQPQTEIEEIDWVGKYHDHAALSHIVRNRIVPHLIDLRLLRW